MKNQVKAKDCKGDGEEQPQENVGIEEVENLRVKSSFLTYYPKSNEDLNHLQQMG